MPVELDIDESTKQQLEEHRPDHASMDAFVRQILRDSQNYRCLDELSEQLDDIDTTVESVGQQLASIRNATSGMRADIAAVADDDD